MEISSYSMEFPIGHRTIPQAAFDHLLKRIMSEEHPKVLFKVLIVGDTNVGKTCILVRYADQKYSDKTVPTIGVDYRPVYGSFKGHSIKLMIWDTAGQEKFKSITSSFYHGTHAAVVVYDVTQRATLENLENWIGDIRRICGEIPLVIIGNKCDSKSKDRLSKEEISTFMDEKGFSDQHFIGSALTGENISEAFDFLLNKLMEKTKFVGKKLPLVTAKKTSSCSC